MGSPPGEPSWGALLGGPRLAPATQGHPQAEDHSTSRAGTGRVSQRQAGRTLLGTPRCQHQVTGPSLALTMENESKALEKSRLLQRGQIPDKRPGDLEGSPLWPW